MKKRKFLIALPAFAGSKGFNHRTILIRAIDEQDAINVVKHLGPRRNIGEIKEVRY